MGSFGGMQDRLFDRLDTDPEYDEDFDPYEEVRDAGKRLAAEFDVAPERATDMVLSFGSGQPLGRPWSSAGCWARVEAKAA